MRFAIASVLLLACVASAQEPAAPTTKSSPFVGRWILSGYSWQGGEPLPTLVRLSVKGLEGGGLSVERTCEVTLPDGTRQRQVATTTDVHLNELRLAARFPLAAPTVGLAGAVAGASAAGPRAELDWSLEVTGLNAGRETTYLTTDTSRSSSTNGHRVLLRDLTSSAVSTLVNHGPSKDRYDITFVSDGYSVADLPAFRRHVRECVAQLQATTPFREYWSYINIHKVEVPSAGSGVEGGRGGPPALGTNIGSRFPSADGGKVAKAARRAPGADATVVLCFDDFRSIANHQYTLVSAWDERMAPVAVHELGHVIGKLLDEYSELEPSKLDHVFGTGLVEGAVNLVGWGANVTTHTHRDQVPWRAWLPAGVPVPTPAHADHPVGVYAGAFFLQRKWHRPSPTCLMRDESQPFCVVCREQLVRCLSRKAWPITVKQEQLDRDTVRLTVTSTIPGAHRIAWRRAGGQVVHVGESITATRKDLNWGDTLLWCEVKDLTPFVRSDEDRATTYDLTFVLRKGLLWDRGLDCEGPLRETPAGTGAYGP